MFKNRLFRKLIITYLVLIIASLGLLSIVAINKFSQSYQEEISQHLANTAYTVRAFINDCHTEPNQLNGHITELGRDIQTRITVIDKAGVVLADSGYDRATMENHNDRPEVLSARQNEIGQNIRYSHTLAIDMIYLAIPLDSNKPDDMIIRVSLPLKQVSLITGQVYQTVGITFVFALLIALIMGFWLVSRIVRPVKEMVSVAESISKGDFSRRITVKTGDEIGALADAINLMNAKLKELFAEAAKYETLRRDFVANASHELRTPLSLIKGYVETIKEGRQEDWDKMQEFLGIIDRNVNQLDNLVRDLLELSRLEYQKGIALNKPCNINDIIKSVLDDLEPFAALKKQTIIKNIPSDTPAIRTDAELLKKAISNLLDNAIKYTPESGKIEIDVTADAQRLTISIKDNGIGIPGEDLARVFERFYRVDKSRSREMGGTGLGLSIVKHIVQTLKGEVTVTSQPNQGSTFIIKLPIIQE
ncbi:MAG: HAMP domain-containing protein [Planctomycetes bacterium]|nr:HAMP domain-containing protein [Planctomycetota bacterium]